MIIVPTAPVYMDIGCTFFFFFFAAHYYYYYYLYRQFQSSLTTFTGTKRHTRYLYVYTMMCYASCSARQQRRRFTCSSIARFTP